MERKKHLCFDCKNAYAGKCEWLNIENGGTENAIPKGCEFCLNKNGYKITQCPNFVSDILTKKEIAKKKNISYRTYLRRLKKIREKLSQKFDMTKL